MEIVAVGALQCLFSGGGVEDMEDCERPLLRNPYKPPASNPATVTCTFCNP